MQTLILSEGKGGLPKVQLTKSPNIDLKTMISWRIDTGRKALVINGRFHAVTRKLWMFGNISSGATYGCELTEMYLILTELMGPCDQEPHIIIDDGYGECVPQPARWPLVLAGACHFTLLVMYHAIRMIAVLVAVPFIILFFSKRK